MKDCNPCKDCQFQPENGHSIECSKYVVDNSTTYCFVETPKDWKCKKAQCSIDYKHTHSNNETEESEAVKKYRELGILILENPELSFWEAIKEFSELQ